MYEPENWLSLRPFVKLVSEIMSQCLRFKEGFPMSVPYGILPEEYEWGFVIGLHSASVFI